jgi:hypothetical protein
MTAHTTIFFNGLRAMRLAGEEMIPRTFLDRRSARRSPGFRPPFTGVDRESP